MRINKEYLNELLNSRLTLNEKETELVERYIESVSKPVNSNHLNHYKCLAAIRNQ